MKAFIEGFVFTFFVVACAIMIMMLSVPQQ